MCGLVAVIAKSVNGFFGKEVDVFAQLLYADQLRGSDGTGIFYNPKRTVAQTKILKGAYQSSIFVGTDIFQSACATIMKESNFVVGHNRAATRGKIDVSCTHPFREKHITLVHNGTLLSHAELNKESEVDSHAICVSIANIGAEETLKKVDGAFALIWFDSKTKTLNLCRNWQRPLYIIECTTCFIVVSELELGLWIAKRNSLIVIKEQDVTPKKLYKFTLGAMDKWAEQDLEYFTYKLPKQTQYTSNNIFSIGSSKEFTFGQKVRFRSGNIRTTVKNVEFIEGDILKYQQIHSKHVISKDFEDGWRVRVFGTKEFLNRIKENKENQNFVGTVGQTFNCNGETHYILNDIKPYQEKPVEIKKENTCGWCHKKFTEKPVEIHNFLLCPDCASEMSYTC